MRERRTPRAERSLAVRHWLLVSVILLPAAVLAARAFDLQLNRNSFLSEQARARQVRNIVLGAHRGMLLDRNGEPLAVSTPVSAVWVNPESFNDERQRWPELARILGISPRALEKRLRSAGGRSFVYLRRGLAPALAERVRQLDLAGVYLQREYRRYYPAGEIAAHLVGFTDIDDRGQEGAELAFDEALRGRPGRARVVRDRLRRWVTSPATSVPPHPGADVTLSLDSRLQYLAYHQLQLAAKRYKPRAATVIVLDATSGELLAQVNWPSYNPNDRGQRSAARVRNRAFTDLFEPGSTIKPLTVLAALDRGLITPGSEFQTAPGWLQMAGYRIRDTHNHGLLTTAGIIEKSSNVGAVLIGSRLTAEQLWQAFDGLGIGHDSGSGFPGEATGILALPERWRPIEQATRSYGYGLSVTPIQLARAYLVFATGGRVPPVSLTRITTPDNGGALRYVADSPPALFSAAATRQVVQMMQGVVSATGTGRRAAVAGYRVAGKTGTTFLSTRSGYSRDRYVASFIGLAPAGAPRLLMLVTMTDPEGDAYYGGEVAAPLFAAFMSRALPLLGVAPDTLETQQGLLVRRGDSAPGALRLSQREAAP